MVETNLSILELRFALVKVKGQQALSETAFCSSRNGITTYTGRIMASTHKTEHTFV